MIFKFYILPSVYFLSQYEYACFCLVVFQNVKKVGAVSHITHLNLFQMQHHKPGMWIQTTLLDIKLCLRMDIHSCWYLRLVRVKNITKLPNPLKMILIPQSVNLYLLQGSLNALNKLLKEPVSINRFRPKYLSRLSIKFLYFPSTVSISFLVVFDATVIN